MKKIHTPNHKFYEQYYLDQAKQKGGNLPAFHGARFERGNGLGSIFRGLFRWAVPHLQEGAKMLGKKALQTGVDVAQDVLAGENLKTATKKRAKQALGLPSQDSPQSGAGKKGTKRKAQPRKNSSPRQETENISAARETRRQIFLLEVKMAFVHHESQECTKSELDLFTIPAIQTSITKGRWIENHLLRNINDTGPIEFNVSGTGEEYLDLTKTQLLVKGKITKANGTALDAETKVGPVNLFLHSLFSQVDVSLNERLISPSTNTYPYRAMIETLLLWGRREIESTIYGHVLQRYSWKDGCRGPCG